MLKKRQIHFTHKNQFDTNTLTQNDNICFVEILRFIIEQGHGLCSFINVKE